MRRIGAVCLVAMGGMLAGAPPGAVVDIDTVPPFKGNDTGGIIAYSARDAGGCPPARRRSLRLATARWLNSWACRPTYGGYVLRLPLGALWRR